MDLVISEFLDEEALQRIPANVDWHYDPGLVDDRARLLHLIADIPALIVRSYIRVDRELLDHAPNLKVIGRLGVGLDNFDLDACAERGVEVLPATGGNADSVGEYAVAMALTLLRGAYRSTAEVAAGGWPRARLMGHEAQGHRFGVIGFGNTGQAAARRALALGMAVSADDPYVAADDARWRGVTRATFDAVIASADIVSLHVPLTGETRHMIDAAAIARMKPGAVLINAARGGVADEDAVIAALRDGHLGGAAFDVFETEPLTATAGARFADAPNLILTPHIAGVTHEANTRISTITVDNVIGAMRRLGLIAA